MGKLRFTVTIPKEDSDIAFLNWDRFVNQYAKFNIGGICEAGGYHCEQEDHLLSAGGRGRHSKSAWITY